jgi:hypothetical protein
MTRMSNIQSVHDTEGIVQSEHAAYERRDTLFLREYDYLFLLIRAQKFSAVD